MLFYTLDGETHSRMGFIIEQRYPQGCQFTNTHNGPVSSIGACNTNVQTRDWAQGFYHILYGPKSTIKEDSAPWDLVARDTTQKLLREQEGGTSTGPQLVGGTVNDTFRDQCSIIKDSDERSNVGLIIISHAARGALCVLAWFFIVTPWADGSCASWRECQFHLSKCTGGNGTKLTWPDASTNDYLSRPAKLVAMCSTEKYSKGYTQKHQEKAHNNSDTSSCDFNTSELMLVEGHPSYRHAYLQEHAHL